MTKLIRGKIIIEPKNERTDDDARLSDVSLVPLDLSDPHDDEDVLNEADFGETDLIPERDGATFASAIAPWVGAERAWREGILPPPHTDASDYPKYAVRDHGKTPFELELSDADMETVLSSLPPATRSGVSKHFSTRTVIAYLSVAVVAIGLAFAVESSRDDVRGVTSASASVDKGFDTPVALSQGAICRESAAPDPEIEELVDISRTVRSAGVTPALSTQMSAATLSAVSLAVPSSVDDTLSVDETSRGRARRTAQRTEDRVASKKVNAASTALATSSKETVVEDAEQNTESEAPAPVQRVATTSEEADPGPESKVAAAPDTVKDTAPESMKDAALRSMAAVLEMAKLEAPEEMSADVDDLTQDAALQEERAPASTLSEPWVKQTLDSLAPVIRKCGNNGASGRVVVQLVVAGRTGRVISAKAVDPEEVGAIAGRCVARTVELAKFPSFKKTRMIIRYPFDL